MKNRLSKQPRIGILVVFAFLGTVYAEVDRNRELILDFTQPERIKAQAAWSDSGKISATAAGLGWDGEANAYRDVAIWTIQPIPVGWTWHPLTSVYIEAKGIPPGDFKFMDTNTISWPTTAGSLYVRYSADASHWSTWQSLDLVAPISRSDPKLRFRGTVGVPEQARQVYRQWLDAFLPLGSRQVEDEEAAAKWIQMRDPSFFVTQKPFIGYVDFLWEKSIRGNEPLKQLRIEIGYGRSGKAPVPAGHTEKGYWRFKTDD